MTTIDPANHEAACFCACPTCANAATVGDTIARLYSGLYAAEERVTAAEAETRRLRDELATLRAEQDRLRAALATRREREARA
jgi:septal ring factor EnvC (AmiA/AmiB activator)